MKTIEDILNEIGVVNKPKELHAPISKPKEKKKIESTGWKPSYQGEEPPF